MPRRAAWPPPIYPQNPKPGEYTRARIYRDGRAVNYPLGPHGSEEAQAAYRRLLLDLSAGTAPMPTPTTNAPTVRAVLVRWLDHAREHYSPEGREYDQHVLAVCPLRAVYGDEPAAEFSPKKLERLQLVMATGEWMTEAEKAKATARGYPVGWCRNVVNRRTVRIQTAWRWAEREGLVPAGSHAHLCTVGRLPGNARGVRNTTRRAPAFWEHVEAVVPHCPPAVAAMLQLQFLAALRSSEVRLMRTLDVDTSDPSCWTFRPGSDAGEHGSHKGAWREQDRVIAFGPRAIEILRPWLRPDNPTGYLFRPLLKARKLTGGVPTYKERSYRDTYYAQAVRRACGLAGVAFTPYGLRHGRRMDVSRTVGDEAARMVLGHKSVNTTLLYGSLDAERAAELARKLG